MLLMGRLAMPAACALPKMSVAAPSDRRRLQYRRLARVLTSAAGSCCLWILLRLLEVLAIKFSYGCGVLSLLLLLLHVLNAEH